MYVYQFLTGLHLITGILVPFFTEVGNMSFPQMMIIQGWFFFWMLVLEVPTGIFADAYGRKNSIIIGTIALLIGICAYVLPSHLAAFLIGSFLWAFGLTLISGADEALIYDTLTAINEQHESKQVYNIFHGLHHLGWAIGAPLASTLAVLIGLKSVVAIMAIPFIFALVMSCSLQEPPRTQEPYHKILRDAWKCIRTTRPLRLLGANEILIGAALFVALWTHQQMMREMAVPIVWFGWIQTGVMGLASFVGMFSVIGFLERVLQSKRRYLLASGIIPALGVACVGITHSSLLAALLIIGSLGFGFPRVGPLTSYMHKYINDRERATTASLFNAIRNSIRMGYSLLVAFIAQWSLPAAFFAISAAIFIVAVWSPLKEEHLID